MRYVMKEEFISLKDAEGSRFLVNKKTIKTVIEMSDEDDSEGVIVDFFEDEAVKVVDTFEDIAFQLHTPL